VSEAAALQTQPTKAPPSNSHSLLVQRKCACGGSSGLTGSCSGCETKKLLGKPLQTKLRVNQPGDAYEQEADRMADQVMEAPVHSSVSGAPPSIQRLATQPAGHMEAVPASVDQALAKPGRPLEPALRNDMEQRFDHDFSSVRVHTGAAGEQSAHDIDANAYTVGRDVVFGAGQYAPATTAGKKLIAHELTHVVQQGHATSTPLMLRRSPRKGAKGRAKASAIDPKTARLVTQLILNIIAGVETTHPSRWPADRTISKYRDLLSLWFDLKHGRKADGSKLEGEAYASAFERAKAETNPIFHASLQAEPKQSAAVESHLKIMSDLWFDNYLEIETRAESERRITKLVETTTSFWLASSPEPVSFDEFLKVATANNTRSVRLQRGAGIPIWAVAGQTYYPSGAEARLLLWASPEGVFFMVGDEIYKQSIAGFSDDIILGIIIKAAQDVAPFVDLITAVVEIAISVSPIGPVYDLTMAGKAIAEGKWKDAALQLLPGTLGEATKLPKATRIGAAAFRGTAKGAKLLGKAIKGPASFVGRGMGRIGRKLKPSPGVWLVTEGVGEASGGKAYHFLDEAGVWHTNVSPDEAQVFIKCTKCDLTPDGKGLGATKGQQGVGLSVELTEKQSRRLKRVSEALKDETKWGNVSAKDRWRLGRVYDKLMESLVGEGIRRAGGKVLHYVEVDAKLLEKLRATGERVVIMEGRLSSKGLRFDMLEIDFAKGRVELLDLTATSSPGHLAKTRDYKTSLEKLLKLPVEAKELIYTGPKGELLETLIEVPVK
jgi:hypothetical protein